MTKKDIPLTWTTAIYDIVNTGDLENCPLDVIQQILDYCDQQQQQFNNRWFKE